MNNTISNNTVNNNTHEGIYLYSSSNNNYITNNSGTGNNIGLAIKNWSSTQTIGNILTGNTFCGNTADLECDSEDQVFNSTTCDSGAVCGGTCTPC